MLLTGGALTTALLFGGCYAGVRSRENRARTATPPVGQFVSVNGKRVHYVVAGQPPQGRGQAEKPAIVLIHGAGSNLREWTFSLMGQLTDEFTVIAFDRPGHGYTETIHSRGESPAEQAALLHGAMQQIGIRRAIVGGHSFGGAVALAWTLNHPESVAGTLLISAVSNRWEGDVAPLYRLTGGTFTGALISNTIAAATPKERVISGFNSVFRPQAAPAGYAEHMGADLAVRASQMRANGRQVSAMKPHVVAMAARYGEITTPVEIIHGTADDTVPARVHADVLVRQIPHAVYQRMEGMGHGAQQLAHPEILSALGRLKAAYG